MNRTEGCLGASIIGLDGIAVERVSRAGSQPANLDIAIAEYTALLKKTARINSDQRVGKLREMTLSCDDLVFILRFVGSAYFSAMVMTGDGNFGRGRYELRLAELMLEPELVV